MITAYLKRHPLQIILTVALAGLFSANLHAQEDLKALIYGSDSAAAATTPLTSATGTLGTIEVNQIYTSSSGYTYNFIGDSSGVFGYIYVAAGSADPFTVGDTYTGLTLDSGPYSGNLELEVDSSNSAAALVPSSTDSTTTYTPVAEGVLTTTSPLSDNYTVTSPIDEEPVQFTFTAPATQTITPITGSASLTDPTNNDKISFYRPETGLTFTAGTTYTIDGLASVYSSGVEIYDPSIVATPTPEPATYVMMGVGGLGLVLFARRTRRAKLG